MRYLIISDEYRPVIGGIARVAGALADGLVGRGHQVTVLTNAARGRADETGKELAEIKYYHRPGEVLLGKLYLMAWWPIAVGRWIRRERFDRIIVVDPANALPLPILSAFGSVPYEVLLHGSELIRYSRRRWTDLLLRRSLANAARLFSTTRFVERELRLRYGHICYLTSCGVGGNFLDSPSDAEQLAALRRRYGFAAGDFVIGTISRLDKRKGNDIVVEAVYRLADRFPQLKYLIGGVGPEFDPLRALVARCGLSDRVVFTGRIAEEELVNHYEMLDAYVMPNRWLSGCTVEGFGISFAEAASRGVPSIGVDNGGVSESVADNVSGILLSRPDADELAAALIRLLRGQLTFDTEAVRRHGQQFTWERFVDRIVHPVAA
jgi:phosphatidylinositol alpha-1,6-mannosyltransferase